jgi:hypothetical protein
MLTSSSNAIMLTLFVGLISHLKSHFPPLYQLFLYMKLQTEHPLTPGEIQFASGQKPFGSSIHVEYLQNLMHKHLVLRKHLLNRKPKQLYVFLQCLFHLLTMITGALGSGKV